MLNLVVVDASGRRSVSVPSGPFTIGRSSDTQLQLNDAHVSRRHAELIQDGSNWRVRDLGSRGGTFVHGGRSRMFDGVSKDSAITGSGVKRKLAGRGHR